MFFTKLENFNNHCFVKGCFCSYLTPCTLSSHTGKQRGIPWFSGVLWLPRSPPVNLKLPLFFCWFKSTAVPFTNFPFCSIYFHLTLNFKVCVLLFFLQCVYFFKHWCSLLAKTFLSPCLTSVSMVFLSCSSILIKTAYVNTLTRKHAHSRCARAVSSHRQVSLLPLCSSLGYTLLIFPCFLCAVFFVWLVGLSISGVLGHGIGYCVSFSGFLYTFPTLISLWWLLFRIKYKCCSNRIRPNQELYLRTAFRVYPLKSSFVLVCFPSCLGTNSIDGPWSSLFLST